MLLARGFIDWNMWQYRELAIRSQWGHIQVHAAGYSEHGAGDPFAFLLADDAPERQIVEAAAHVRAVAPRLNIAGLASRGEVTRGFVGEGVDPEKETALAEGLLLVAGEALSASDPHGALLGQGLASALGLKPGDSFVVLANTKQGGVNGIDVTVRGIFATVSKDYDDSALRMPIVTAQSLLRTRGAHAWLVVLDDTDLAPRVLADLAGKLGDKVELVPWWRLADFYNKSAALLSVQVRVMTVIVAVLIVLGIGNTLTMAVMERTPEIGTVMALGTKRAGILQQFLLEGALLGVFGGLLGLALGAVLGWAITLAEIPMPPPPGMARDFPAGVRISLPLVRDALALGALTTLLATLLPAWRAASVPIVDALRRAA